MPDLNPNTFPPPEHFDPALVKTQEPGYEGKKPAFGIGPTCDCDNPTSDHEPTCAVMIARLRSGGQEQAAQAVEEIKEKRAGE